MECVVRGFGRFSVVVSDVCLANYCCLFFLDLAIAEDSCKMFTSSRRKFVDVVRLKLWWESTVVSHGYEFITQIVYELVFGLFRCHVDVVVA
jgi:hypothetical protein